jgi:hypothetical protein
VAADANENPMPIAFNTERNSVIANNRHHSVILSAAGSLSLQNVGCPGFQRAAMYASCRIFDRFRWAALHPPEA